MSVKLLTVEGAVSTTAEVCSKTNRGTEQVSVTPDALVTIGELPQVPLNLTTIWGRARTGKSYIMNLLARREKGDIFPVSGGFKACTVGADMSKATVGLESFSRCSYAAGAEELGGGRTPDIGFVDVEGQGDRHQSQDILLATPLLILSKVVIFNWLGRPNKNTVLGELATMSEAATFINRGQRGNAFGHLILLLRDVQVNGEKEVYSIVFENEDSDGASTDEEATAMEERNKTRNLLKKTFETVRVVCMPSPHAEIGDRSVSVDEVKPAFATKLSGLRDTLSGILREPHQFGGQPVVGGVMFTSLLSDLCERVNQGAKDIVPLGLMESIHQRRAQKSLEQALEIFKTLISAFEDGPAQSKAATAKALEQVEAEALDKFAMGTQGLNERAVTKAQATLDVIIQELTTACKTRQEKRVADAKVKVVEITESISRTIDDEDVKDIMAALPIGQGPMSLNQLWTQKCLEWHELLKRSIDSEVPAGLLIDLETSLPTRASFQNSMKGKLEQLQVTNQQLIEVKRQSEEHLRRQEEDAKEQILKIEGQAQENMRQYVKEVEMRFKDQKRQAAEETSRVLQQAEHRQQLAVEEAHRKATVQMREEAAHQQSRMETARGYGTTMGAAGAYLLDHLATYAKTDQQKSSTCTSKHEDEEVYRPNNEVERFLTLERGAPAPQGKGWNIATAEEVRANPDLLPKTRSGLGDWYIAALADDMKVTGMGYGNTVERRDTKEGLGHVLYSYKRG
ncbi:unnamed protein product [Ascophyllum nodosum]